MQQLAPHLTYAVLAPAIGDAEALHVSGLAPVPVIVPVPEPVNDGQRVAAAFAALVAEQGYAATTLKQAARRAKVDAAVVGEYFDEPADCALQALDAWTDRTFAAMAAAFASAPRDGALALHRALGAMLAQMAAEPDMLHLAVEAFEHLGPRALARRARYASVFFDAISPTVAPEDPIPAEPRVVTEMLAEGVFGVLRTYVDREPHRRAAGRAAGDQLPVGRALLRARAGLGDRAAAVLTPAAPGVPATLEAGPDPDIGTATAAPPVRSDPATEVRRITPFCVCGWTRTCLRA